MDGKFGGFVIDLNETPLSSPRETILDDNDDVVIIERPPAAVEVGRRNGAAAAAVAGGGSTVVCVGCGDGFKGKIVGNSEEMKNWKCFKCLLRNGGSTGRGRGIGGGGRGVGLLDINASPPREAEAEAEGAHVGTVVDVAAVLARRGGGGGDKSHGSKYESCFLIYLVSYICRD